LVKYAERLIYQANGTGLLALLKEPRMATTKSNPSTAATGLAQTAREQLAAAVEQGQQLSLDVARTWARALSVLPVPGLPAVPGGKVPSAETAARFTFDITGDLLNAQRDFTLNLVQILTPTKD